MTDVMISYSSLDTAIASRICEALEVEGLHCWIAHRDIPAGATWAWEVMRAIEGATMLLLVYTRHADDSAQVLREFELAQGRSMPVLVVAAQEAAIPEGSAHYLEHAQWLDATSGSMDSHMPEVVSRVNSALSLARGRRARRQIAPDAWAVQSRRWLIWACIPCICCFGWLFVYRRTGKSAHAALLLLTGIPFLWTVAEGLLAVGSPADASDAVQVAGFVAWIPSVVYAFGNRREIDLRMAYGRRRG